MRDQLSARILFFSCLLLLPQCEKAQELQRRGSNLKNRGAITGKPHHNFPLSPASPSKMQVVNAFPRLTFTRPIFLLSPNDGSQRIFVVEQDGTIVSFRNSPETETTTLFLDISELVTRNHEEEGLLGMAFDPDFVHNGFFYVNYTAPDPLRTVIARYHVSNETKVADPESAQVIMEFDQPFANHNGGMLAFGPDGMLYIGTGDGGSGGDPFGNGQKKSTLLGKILRIDTRATSASNPYSVPKDNPFIGEGNGVRSEIWAYGIRNPWRFSFDRNSGKLWAGDVGQDKYEEIDIIEKGGNYGWNTCEGFHRYGQSGSCPSQYQAPIFEYSHQVGPCIVGGYVYRGSRLPTLRGAYIYGDNVTKQLWALVYNGQEVASNTLLGTLPMNLSSFGEDDQGEIYALGLKQQGAKIYRFEESPNQPPPPPFPQKLSETGLFTDLEALTPEASLIPYEVNMPLWSDGAEKSRWMSLPEGEKIEFSPKDAWNFPVGTALVKHFEIRLSPTKKRRLETRVLLHEESGWAGYTYKWNDTQKEAYLLVGAESETYTIEDDPRNHRTHKQTWNYPSRTDCLRCHTAPSGQVLGVRTEQVNLNSSAHPEQGNQLSYWNKLNLFTSPISDPKQYPAFPSLGNDQVTKDKIARAYLAVNCAHCHQPEGGAPSNLNLNASLSLENTHSVNAEPASGNLGIPNAKILIKGNKEQSILWQRMRRRDDKQMPPLGSTLVDTQAAALIGDWIDSLP